MEVKGQHHAPVAVPWGEGHGTNLLWDYVGLKDNMDVSEISCSYLDSNPGPSSP